MLNDSEQPTVENDDRPNIILTGFMGTGKSTVGRLLAERLGYRFVDTDGLIEERTGKTITALFATEGEEVFRELEAAVAVEVGGQRGQVVATGGGLMLDPTNAAALMHHGRTFCLVADPATIVDRLESELSIRPLLAGPEPALRIAALLRERAAQYSHFEQVDTEYQSPEEVVWALLALFKADQ